MLSKIAACRSLSVLALLSLLLWAGHALAGYAGGNGQAAQAIYDDHSHSHDNDSAGQDFQLWGDHQHTSLTADHVHETPHLNAWLPAHGHVSAGQPAFAYAQRLAHGPHTRIERPPRS
ncbi:TPA: hypothetical protein ACPWE6_005898 [Pseudomonas aeruginosa]